MYIHWQFLNRNQLLQLNCLGSGRTKGAGLYLCERIELRVLKKEQTDTRVIAGLAYLSTRCLAADAKALVVVAVRRFV